jgi:hypothetical protein
MGGRVKPGHDGVSIEAAVADLLMCIKAIRLPFDQACQKLL